MSYHEQIQRIQPSEQLRKIQAQMNAQENGSCGYGFDDARTQGAEIASEADREIEGLKMDAEALRADHRHTVNNLCNDAWQAVYGGSREDWEYPAQAIRHLIDYSKELKAQNADLLAALEVLDAYAQAQDEYALYWNSPINVKAREAIARAKKEAVSK